jgi:BolA family transcriptional regulator, general stress-responsive regulator
MEAFMSISNDLQTRLQTAFSPRELEVINDSAKHHGHAGDDGSGESHFTIRIRADAFAGLSRLQRHRAVHAALGDLNTRIHALALDISD